jgi:MtN3 and saliva related transmembrane protein
MEGIVWLGLVAATFTTVSLVPQFLHSIKTRNKPTREKTIATFSMLFCIGIFLWFLYGVLKNDIAIMVANVLSFSQGLIILIIQIRRLRMGEKEQQVVN